MDNSIAISVLITTYNLVNYIDETLESVVNQKFDHPYEIIIGDDGSNDGTIDKLEQWKERYPELIMYYVMDGDPNVIYNRIERASLNRMNILSHAKGKYLVILDGDDFYVDNYKFQKQFDMMELEENKDYVLCGHNVWKYYSDDKKELLGNYKAITKLKPRDFWKKGYYCCSNSLMIRNCFSVSELPDIAQKNFDDNTIIFCMFKYGGIICTEEPMTCYRQLDSSSWNTVNDIERNIINLMDYFIERKINPSFSSESLKRHLFNFFYIRLKLRDIPKDLKKKYLDIAESRNDKITINVLKLYDNGWFNRFRFDVWLIGKIIANIPLIVWKMFHQR